MNLHSTYSTSTHSTPALWGRLADWIARQDRPIPFYHRCCLLVWLWAFRHAV